jgi:hypothetical protein
MADNPKYLTRALASGYLRATWGLARSHATLAKLAVSGDGPAYHRSGRDTLYAPADLDAWAMKLIGQGAFSAIEHRLAEKIAA